MKVFSISLFCLLLAFSSQAQEDKKAKKKAVQDFSYAYGYRFAKSLNEKEDFESIEKDEKYVLKGIKAGLKPDSSQLATLGQIVATRVEDKEYKATADNSKIIAYNLGYLSVANVIYNFDIPEGDFNYACVKAGVKDFNKGNTPDMTEEKIEETITAYFQALQDKMEAAEKAEQEVLAKANADAGAAFLKKNGAKKGVTTTASGLQYEVIRAGTGKQPLLTDKVKVHYHGTMIDGKVFDSSVDRGEPISFPLSGLIQGWQEGIPLMKEGAKYKFFIPSELAYGTDAPPSIGPNQTLIFEVELLKIQEEVLKTAKEKMSYSYGYVIAQSLGQANLTAEEQSTESFVQGWIKGFEKNENTMANSDEIIKARFQGGPVSADAKTAEALGNAIGYSSSSSMALQLGIQLNEFDTKMIAKGFEDAKTGAEALLDKEQINAALQAFFQPKQEAADAKIADADAKRSAGAIEAGVQFLAENAKKEGVVTLPSGLQYQILKEGTGEKPTATSKVTTHYHGTLIDGSVFDSSVERGSPATFPVNGVIQGWQEGLPLMKKGAKYRFFIPQELAYGMRSPSPKIPAGSALIFDVELIEISN